jgi:hypothetical protein
MNSILALILISHENPSKDTDFHPSMYEVMIHGGVS